MALEAGLGHHPVRGDGVEVAHEFAEDRGLEDCCGPGVPEGAGDDLDRGLRGK